MPRRVPLCAVLALLALPACAAPPSAPESEPPSYTPQVTVAPGQRLTAGQLYDLIPRGREAPEGFSTRVMQTSTPVLARVPVSATDACDRGTPPTPTASAQWSATRNVADGSQTVDVWLHQMYSEADAKAYLAQARHGLDDTCRHALPPEITYGPADAAREGDETVAVVEHSGAPSARVVEETVHVRYGSLVITVTGQGIQQPPPGVQRRAMQELTLARVRAATGRNR